MAARYWNIWWTLSVVFLGLAVLTAVLEYLGFFRDLGVILTIIGVGTGLFFGLTGATRTSVSLVGEVAVNVVVEVQAVKLSLDRIERILTERLPRA